MEQGIPASRGGALSRSSRQKRLAALLMIAGAALVAALAARAFLPHAASRTPTAAEAEQFAREHAGDARFSPGKVDQSLFKQP